MACDPICKLERLLRALRVGAGDDRLLETTKEDPPTAPPMVGVATLVKALVEATKKTARRHNRRKDFMVIVGYS